VYLPKITGQFKKDIKLCVRRGYDMDLINRAIELLCEKGTLPPDYLSHPLHGNHAGDWECHIQPDWLMIWYINTFENAVYFTRTGTHSDLFKK
jgi:mRNA interferase YafQ